MKTLFRIASCFCHLFLCIGAGFVCHVSNDLFRESLEDLQDIFDHIHDG